jgi:caffeoyl-CoA O-methyltransferase
MLSGDLQGRLLAMLSHLVRPRIAVDIGTFTGYSALCLAEGLAPDGMVHTIDPDDERHHIALRAFESAGMQHNITLHAAPAADVLPTLLAPFDLVFIDADKEQYPLYFDLVIDKVRPGGLIIADNVLWKGQVASQSRSPKADLMDAFNKKIASDPRILPVMLPLRDGLTLMWKK